MVDQTAAQRQRRRRERLREKGRVFVQVWVTPEQAQTIRDFVQGSALDARRAEATQEIQEALEDAQAALRHVAVKWKEKRTTKALMADWAEIALKHVCRAAELNAKKP